MWPVLSGIDNNQELKKKLTTLIDNMLSLQNYIHGSSQGQFVAETYIVFLLSILVAEQW